MITLVGLLIIGGIVAALVGGGEERPEATRPAAASERTSPTPEPTEEPSTAPAPPEDEPYSSNGPKYEVAIVDGNQGPAKLSQYWIHTAPDFDVSKAPYKDQVKPFIADIAHEQGTVDFIAQVVTNREIAEASHLRPIRTSSRSTATTTRSTRSQTRAGRCDSQPAHP